MGSTRIKKSREAIRLTCTEYRRYRNKKGETLPPRTYMHVRIYCPVSIRKAAARTVSLKSNERERDN